MPGTSTPRLSLSTLAGTDLVSGFPTMYDADMAIVDNAITFSSGTLASRPAAALNGRVYYATDTHIYYWDTGSAWDVIMIPGAWASFPSLGASVTAALPAEGRIVGDTVQLRGALETTGTTSTKWGSVPAVMAPVAATVFSVNTDILGNSSGSTHLSVNTDGTITDGQNHFTFNGQYLPLFGLSYPLV